MSGQVISREIIRSAIALSLAVIGLSLSGCSMVGLGIGSAIDGYSRHVPQERWKDPGEGKPIEVFCSDGSVIRGKFESAEYLSTPEYNRRFDLWKTGDSSLSALPSPGSTVTLDLVSEEQVTGELVGYDQLAGQSLAQVRSKRTDKASKTDRISDAVVVVRRSATGAVMRFNTTLMKGMSAD